MVPSGVVICAGLDEVGRGALAGPVTAAAVVLPRRPRIAGLNDSKALSPQAREEIAADIRSVSLGWAVAHVGASEIDSSGIVTAVRAAMRRALAQLAEEPEHVLVDGDRGGVSPSETAVVRGDATVAAIAAASIVAKVARDTLMREMALLYPGYSFAENKGYGTSEHLDAIGRLGLSSEHRRSFAPCGGTQPLF
jgi:ribonuclease HII